MGWGNKWNDKPTNASFAAETLNKAGVSGAQSLWALDLVKSEPNLKDLVSSYATVRNRNLKPTHDPYTNSNAHIYYECNCGAILDPQTKSFAALNNHASDNGWKIRFTDKGYVPYCVKCGEGVE